MMGQQDTAVAGSALRRMILLLAVAAMMAAEAAPAFAAAPQNDNAGHACAQHNSNQQHFAPFCLID